MDKMLNIALPKGRLGEVVYQQFAEAGFPCPALLEKSRKLPIRALASGSGVSRKVLDRYRKYIIMAVLILNGEYPKLSEYLKFVRKGGNA